MTSLNGPRSAKTCPPAYADSEGKIQPAHHCTLYYVSMERKCTVQTLHFAHARRHLFAWRGPNHNCFLSMRYMLYFYATAVNAIVILSSKIQKSFHNKWCQLIKDGFFFIYLFIFFFEGGGGGGGGVVNDDVSLTSS